MPIQVRSMRKFKALSMRLRRDPHKLQSQAAKNDEILDTSESYQEHSLSKLQYKSMPSVFPDGLEVLHDCPNAAFDICFIHGLTGDRRATWTTDQQSAPWPQTLLPTHISEARILTYGYDAYVVRKSAASYNRVIDHATNLLHDLTADILSCNASSRSLVFVVHSLGGLVCKKAILLSRNNPETHLRSVFNRTKGIIFMGTPHKGSWMADWAGIPAAALGCVKSTNKSLFAVLDTESQFLESLQIGFLLMLRELREAGRSLEVTSFFEELPMPLAGKVVSKESATLDGYNSISIHANHSNMVKFGSAQENGYKRLVGELQRWGSQLRDVEPSSADELTNASPSSMLLQRTSKPLSSPLGSTPSYTIHNSGQGWINTNIGPGPQNNNNGAGTQFNGAVYGLTMPIAR